MGSVKNKERILEAIDQLRRRKARPCIQRICNYLFRHFSINYTEAKADLQWCVDHDVVLKVEYKGSTSYRNAAKKFSHIKRDNQQDSFNIDKANRKFAQLLTNAFGELVVHEPDYLEFGVPEEELIFNILKEDSVRYTEKYVSILIEKEVENGGLIKMENNKYLMGPTKEEGRKSDCDANKGASAVVVTPDANARPKKRPSPKLPKKPTEIMDSDEKKAENGSNLLRVGGRRKRAKKVFDPSDTHVPKKRGRPAGSLNRSTIEKQLARLSDESRPESRASSSGGREHGGVCSVCHLQNKRGPSDRMVSCRECSNKAHYGCLNSDDMMLRMQPDNTWQCPHCKTCVICYETADAGTLTVCAVCADAYHTTCHVPRPIEKAKNVKWLCINCEMPEELKINQIQANMGQSFLHKTSISNGNNSSSPSMSGNTTPTFQSPPSSPTPPRLSPQNGMTQNGDGMSDSQSGKDSDDDNIDPSIPDATNWTSEEVYQYFARYFPKEAVIFREQEIDGRSLLLLKRIDVLTNLKLKLGPALKIYKHVVKLQVRRDDPKLYWL